MVETRRNSEASGGVTKTKSKQKQKKSKSSISQSQPHSQSEDSSPCIICKSLVTDEGIKCDRCGGWAHGISQGGCCGLSAPVFDFIANTQEESIKWFCPSCEKDCNTKNMSIDRNDNSDQHSNFDSKLEALTAVVVTLQQQNSMILDHLVLSKEKTSEEKVKIQVTEAMENQREKEKRINNLMVFNVEESVVTEGQEIDKDDEMNHDVTSLSNIFSTVDPQFNKSSIENVIRLGRRKGNEDQKSGPRPIKVTLKDGNHKSAILKYAWRLKDSKNLRKVGISPDETIKERNERKALRNELEVRKKKGEDVIIFQGKIVPRNKRSDKDVQSVHVSGQAHDETETKSDTEDVFVTPSGSQGAKGGGSH